MDQVSHVLAQLAKRPLFCDTVEILFEKIRAVGCAGRGLRVDVANWYPSNEATFVRAAPTAPSIGLWLRRPERRSFISNFVPN